MICQAISTDVAAAMSASTQDTQPPQGWGVSGRGGRGGIIIIIIIIATIKGSAPVLNSLMEYLLIA